MTAEPRARVVRLRLKTQAAFPVSDDLSIPLLRLMAATNDTRQLQKLVLSTRDPARPPQGRSEALVQNGELLYYVRLFFGHLYEAGKAFRELDDRHRARVDVMLASDTRSQAALATLRAVFWDRTPQGFDNGVLAPIRNLSAFYKDDTFRNGVATLQEDTELVVAEWVGFSRHAITDAILERRVIQAAGATPAAFDASLRRALELAEALETTVQALVGEFLRQRPATWSEVPPESVPIPDALRDQAVQRANLSGGGA